MYQAKPSVSFALAGVLALSSCAQQLPASRIGSLTEPGESVRKIFFGWAEPFPDGGESDPTGITPQGNEARFDLRHLSHIFGQESGGLYETKTLIEPNEVTHDQILGSMKSISSSLSSQDMYIQYSAGHGLPSGLGVGVTYDEIRDAILNFEAKEVIVFIMSCFSGGLVQSFDSVSSEWQSKWKGRTLFVMSSSAKDQTSSSGPSEDPDELMNIPGSAGSLFGFYLWKGLMGYANKNQNGADQYVTLGELRDYIAAHVEGQTPQWTGVYDPALRLSTLSAPAAADPRWAPAKKAFDDVTKGPEDQVKGILNEMNNNFFTETEKEKELKDYRLSLLGSMPEGLKQKRSDLESGFQKLLTTDESAGSNTADRPVYAPPAPYFKPFRTACFSQLSFPVSVSKMKLGGRSDAWWKKVDGLCTEMNSLAQLELDSCSPDAKAKISSMTAEIDQLKQKIAELSKSAMALETSLDAERSKLQAVMDEILEFHRK